MAIKETFSPNIVKSSFIERKLSGSYTVVDAFEPPKLRSRTLVLHTKKLKPHMEMNVYISDILMNAYFVPATMVEVSPGNKIFGFEDTSIRTDNVPYRTTSIGSYDIVKCGDVITCTTGTAVVISDETIYDKVSATNKRILYVCNVKGTLTGTITGAISGSTAVVNSVTSGTRTTNSLGNFYGILIIPSSSIDAGSHKIFITDTLSSDPNAATTMAAARYLSNGKVNTYTTHNTYTEQNVTTVVDYSTTTWYDVN